MRFTLNRCLRHVLAGTAWWFVTGGVRARNLPSSPACAAQEASRGLVCERPHIDVGETSAINQFHRFQIKNDSDKEVRITATSKACGCVKREFTTYAVAPGGFTEMTLDFPVRTKTGVRDGFLERLTIFTNDNHETPALVLSVGGTYVPVAYRLRDGVYIEVKPTAGKEFTGRIDLFINKENGVKIVSIETLGSLPMEAAIAKREDTLFEGEEKVVLEVKGTLPKGAELPATGTVQVTLNSKDLPQMRIPVTLYKKRGHEVRFSPQMLAFGVLPADSKVMRAISIELPKGGRYALQEAVATGEGVSVAIDERPERKHVALLRCELDAAKLNGKVEQQLLVTIAAPDGPPEVYKLPISGFVKRAEGEKAESEAAVKAEGSAPSGE